MQGIYRIEEYRIKISTKRGASGVFDVYTSLFLQRHFILLE